MAIVIAAGVAATGAIGGAAISSSASKSAANTQAAAAQSANNTQLTMFDQTQQNLQPYMGSGTNALAALNSQLGIGAGGTFNPNAPLVKPFSAAQYQQSPGYAFQMSQGVDAVQNSASAAGGIGGGNTLKALTTFGQGLANSDYQQAYQNYVAQQQQQYGMLSGLANSGQSAAAGLGGISAGVGQSIGQNTIGAGNAQAAGTVGSANALSGGFNSVAQLAALYGNGSYGANYSPYGSGSAGASPYVANTPYGSGANSGTAYCDYALKTGITRVGVDGITALPVYDFWYIDQDQNKPKQRGYMAQDVQMTYPQAVSAGPKGYLMVDYSKVPSADWSELDTLAEDA